MTERADRPPFVPKSAVLRDGVWEWSNRDGDLVQVTA